MPTPQNLKIPTFPGANQDPEDPRDFVYEDIALSASYFDWGKGYDVEEDLNLTLPVKDQNGSYSCVGQATATLAYVHNAFELKPHYEDQLQNHMQELSAKDIYSHISLGFGQGAYLRDGVKQLVNRGINTEKDVPSYETDIPSPNGISPPSEKFINNLFWKTHALLLRAANYKAKEYHVIHAKYDIDMVAQAIKNNHGLLLGFYGENNGTWRDLRPKVSEIAGWGHCTYAGKAKLINGIPHIGFLNSWGEITGDDGWQWFGPDWFKSNMMFNPWVLVDKPNLFFVVLLNRNKKIRVVPTWAPWITRYLVEHRGYTFK